MEAFTVGDVVAIPFPYADFSVFKKRPALIIGKAEFDNFITCQITSKAFTSKIAIPLQDSEFESGGLKRDSFIRPDKLFTVEQSIIQTKYGTLKSTKLKKVKMVLKRVFEIT